MTDIHSVYFVGIGGIGMSALARWFKRDGKIIAGYDKTRTDLCIRLEEEGITIGYEEDVSSIPVPFLKNSDGILIIYTPAIPSENIVLGYFRSNGFEIRKRSEVLGKLTADHFSIAVAGTHGKTTTSSILAHILRESGHAMTAFLGGISINYQSNFIINENPDSPERWVVVEADEYDRSFLTLNPDIAVITALDPDHLDIYNNESEMKLSYARFIDNIKSNGTLIIKKNLIEEVMTDSKKPLNVYEYKLDHQGIRAEDIRFERDEMRFTYVSPDVTISNIPLTFPGFHNVENAIAAITVALLLKIDPQKIKSALATFRGIKRRFEYILYTDRIVFIDDYAHHPEEIKAFLTSVKAIFPDKKITAVFQPHLFSRTRDFQEDFAISLELADETILLDIYPAREKPLAGVSSQLIFDRINGIQKYYVSDDHLVEFLKSIDLEVLVTIGAGNIDRLVLPIKKMLENKYEISA